MKRQIAGMGSTGCSAGSRVIGMSIIYIDRSLLAVGTLAEIQFCWLQTTEGSCIVRNIVVATCRNDGSTMFRS
eukprot:scaffold14271_cov152-Skeletonema_dohrnii-CCMP3373.AAC.3